MAETASARPAAGQMDDDGSSFLDWLRTHAKLATYIGVSAVAVAAAVYMWRRSEAIKEERAEQALVGAAQTFAAGNLPLAQTDLQRLVARYGGTNAGTQARLLLAQILFDQQQVDSGLKVLENVGSGRGGAFAASVHALRGVGLEQASKPAEAAAEFERAASAARGDAERDAFRADAARAYALAGDKDKAAAIWRELASDESSAMNAEAKLRLGELTAKPIGQS
jgi:outer membrane PBP1 activator LpoA protein